MVPGSAGDPNASQVGASAACFFVPPGRERQEQAGALGRPIGMVGIVRFDEGRGEAGPAVRWFDSLRVFAVRTCGCILGVDLAGREVALRLLALRSRFVCEVGYGC